MEGKIDFEFGMLNFGLGWMGEKVGRGEGPSVAPNLADSGGAMEGLKWNI